MAERTDRLLSVLVLLVALLLVSQVTVVPRNRLLSAVGIGLAAVSTAYALVQILDTL